MRTTSFILVMVMASVASAQPSVDASVTKSIKVFASDYWQYGQVDVQPGQTVRLIATGQWEAVRVSGPEGNGVPAGAKFTKPGAPEGALLVQDGAGTVHVYTPNMIIQTPGPLYFVANDEDRNPDRGAGHVGRADNRGDITVRLVMSGPSVPGRGGVKVLATPRYWQYSQIELKAGQTIYIKATGTWNVVRQHGPEGNGVTADKTYIYPGAPEGCLLIKDGSGRVHPYTGQEVVISAPGRIWFMPNEQRVVNRNVGHQGFNDNAGAVTAHIRIR